MNFNAKYGARTGKNQAKAIQAPAGLINKYSGRLLGSFGGAGYRSAQKFSAIC
jgi:hypothetical protein